MSRILRLTSKSVGAGFLLLGLGQLMVGSKASHVVCTRSSRRPPLLQATYAVSLLIQLRSTLPPTMPDLPAPTNADGSDGSGPLSGPPATHDPSLLATLPDFRIFGRLFDVMFLLAAFGTAAYRYAGHKMNGADEFGYVYH